MVLTILAVQRLAATTAIARFDRSLLKVAPTGGTPGESLYERHRSLATKIPEEPIFDNARCCVPSVTLRSFLSPITQFERVIYAEALVSS